MKIKIGLATETPGWQPALLRSGRVVMLGFWNGQRFVMNKDCSEEVGLTSDDAKKSNAIIEIYGNEVAGRNVGAKLLQG